MSKKSGLPLMRLLFASLFAIVCIACSCGDSSYHSFGSVDDGWGPSPECEDKVEPDLLSLILIVNGNKEEMPATVLISDQITIAMEYSDKDCDLADGDIIISPSQDDPNFDELYKYLGHTYIIGDSIGCSSAEDGLYYLHLDPLDYLLPEGVERTVPLEFFLHDICGYASNPYYLPLDFTVVEE